MLISHFLKVLHIKVKPTRYESAFTLKLNYISEEKASEAAASTAPAAQATQSVQLTKPIPARQVPIN